MVENGRLLENAVPFRQGAALWGSAPSSMGHVGETKSEKGLGEVGNRNKWLVGRNQLIRY